MTWFCYTQCKTALDLLPRMKLNVLEAVSALLGKAVLSCISGNNPYVVKHCNSALKPTIGSNEEN